MARRHSWNRRNAWIPFLAIALAYGAFFAARGWWRETVRIVRLETGKPGYLHFELVDIKLVTRDPLLKRRWRQAPPEAVVLRDGKEVGTIGGVLHLPLREDAGIWTARWPVPWNAPEGSYSLSLVDQEDLKERVVARSFKIERRKPYPVSRGFSVLTLESSSPLELMQVTSPDGTKTDWRGLLDWAQYIGADAFWMLGGQTPGLKPGELWVTSNLGIIPKVAAECHKRGLKLGVYAMCYLTKSTDRLPNYEYARDVADGKPFYTRAISLRDPQRPRDVAALLKGFRENGADFVGLDYIRNALGGYELVDEFFAEMPGLHPPAEWPRLTREERMVWLARKKIMRRDYQFIDAWQWWRAHKVGEIVREIRREVGGKTPMWAFTLTWDRGWQHGQDPVMMNDAGVDVDALMFYETDKPQFQQMLRDWKGYARRGDVQLLAGDIVDWPMHQRDPKGPAEMYRRVMAAARDVYPDGPAGVFFHDAGRALWGRTGSWGARGWMDQAKRAISDLRAPGAPR